MDSRPTMVTPLIETASEELCTSPQPPYLLGNFANIG